MDFVDQAQQEFTQQKLDAQHQQEHQEILDTITGGNQAVVQAIISLASILTRHQPKVTIKHPIKSVQTPDVLPILAELRTLVDLEKGEKPDYATPVVKAVHDLIPVLEKIPQAIEMPEPTEEVTVTNLGELQTTLEAILAAIKADVEKDSEPITVNAPEVHVASPDLSGLDERLLAIQTAIQAIPTPPITDMGPVYDGLEEVRNTIANLRFPVPNVITDPLIKYKVADVDDASTVKYYGQIANDGSWVIMKEDDSTTPKTYRYAAGSGSYPTNWTGRVGLTYSYLYQAVNG